MTKYKNSIFEGQNLTIGHRLRNARLFFGYQQKELLGKTPFPHICKKTLYRWEKDGPNIMFMDQIAQFFNLPVKAFYPIYTSDTEFIELLCKARDQPQNSSIPQRTEHKVCK